MYRTLASLTVFLWVSLQLNAQCTSNCVITNPSANQTIVQPSATTFSVNSTNNIIFADQYSSLADAIAAVPSAGGIVMLPAGTTTVSSTITVTKPITVMGRGQDVSFVSFNQSSGDVFTVNSAHVTFKDLTITRSVTATSGAGINFGLPSGCTSSCPIEAQLSQVHITKQFNGLVSADSTFFLLVEKSLFDHNLNHGALLGTIDMRSTQNRFYGNGFTDTTCANGSGSGMVVQDGGLFIVSSGNEFYGNKSTGFTYSGGSSPTNTFHTGDIVDSNGSYGIVVTGMADFAFNDGWIASNGTAFSYNATLGSCGPSYSFSTSIDGALLDHTVSRARLNNNQVTNNARHGILFYGTPVWEASNNQAYNNGQCTSCGGAGLIAVDQSSTQKWTSGRFVGNHAWNMSGTSQAFGIAAQGGAGGSIVILGNDLLSNATTNLDTSNLQVASANQQIAYNNK